MRGEMLPSLLETVAYNLAHGLQSVAIFELGNIYWSDSGQTLPYQAKRVAGALAGRRPGTGSRRPKPIISTMSRALSKNFLQA